MFPLNESKKKAGYFQHNESFPERGSPSLNEGIEGRVTDQGWQNDVKVKMKRARTPV